MFPNGETRVLDRQPLVLGPVAGGKGKWTDTGKVGVYGWERTEVRPDEVLTIKSYISYKFYVGWFGGNPKTVDQLYVFRRYDKKEYFWRIYIVSNKTLKCFVFLLLFLSTIKVGEVDSLEDNWTVP